MRECSRLEKTRSKIRRPFPEKWADIFEKFEQWQIKRYIAEGTRSRYTLTLTLFAEYMIKSGIDDVANITPLNISEYILTMRGNAPTSMQGDLGRIRNFFKFAYLERYIDKNLEDAVPKYGGSMPLKEANIWSAEELERLLSIVDRSNAVGKRDYAIILLAVDLGMRISDITSLSLENIDWERGSVEFNQRKTKGALSLPMTERVGLAIIDYLKYARPTTVCQNVFVSHTPPYETIPRFSARFRWYVQKAGITRKPNRRYGMHSLRNTVATRMLENGIPFDVIFPFVGHSDENTLHRYLGMDIENLRKCALSFEMEV
jgi:site-specific recombinase XerD